MFLNVSASIWKMLTLKNNGIKNPPQRWRRSCRIFWRGSPQSSHGLYGGTPENHCSRRKYQCALPITSKQAHKCQICGKYGKKYSKLVTTLKHITPHKLRSTYGTSLYRETGDIYLVADVLGHKDVNTTRKHYAALEDERRRSAAKYVKLREI